MNGTGPRWILGLLLVGAAGVLETGPATLAATIYVRHGALGADNGTSWADAYVDLQAALAAARSHDEIWVAAGTYRPGGPTAPRTATFRLKNGVAVYGGFSGSETHRSQRDPSAHETILSGDLKADDGPGFQNNVENSYNVVTGTGTDATAVLDGFTVTAGNANGTSLPTNGGAGLTISNGSPTVSSCRFSANAGARYGAGVYTRQCASTFTDCTFSDNHCDYWGGGLFNNFSSPTLVRCAFLRNYAVYGGGMHNDANSSPILMNSVCSLNTAHGGAGISNSISSPRLVHCLFSGNSAVNLGGAMRNLDGSAPQLTNCTIVDNRSAGAFALYEQGNSAAILVNCILWGNRNTAGTIFAPQIVNNTSDCSVTATYSCIQDGWPGQGNISADPLFVDPDGPDDVPQTMDDDYHIQPGSPCVDAGDRTAVPPNATTALDGAPRFVDDPTAIDSGHGGKPAVDMGAYELTDFRVPPRVRLVWAGAAPGGDGRTWATAWNNLAFALSESAQTQPGQPPVDEIWVAAGTYTPGPPDVPNARAATFRLRNRLKLIGGFHPALAPFVPDPVAHETRLSGDLKLDDRGFAGNTENAYHVITASGTDATSLLNGFTVEGGNANAAQYPHNCGGGIFNFQGSPTVINCLLRRNAATDGAGMFNLLGNPHVINCRFIGNRASNWGGGMHNETASLPLVANCTFTGNSAGVSGGGLNALDAYNIDADPNTPTVVNSIFWGNQARIGAELSLQEGRFGFSVLSVAGCNVQGGADGVAVGLACLLVWDAGAPNRDSGPLLAPDGHLRLDSPLVDAGDNALLPADVRDLDLDSDTAEPLPVDCDAADRMVNEAVDVGADEYDDTDQDGLPDAWERRYFGSAAGGDPEADSDGDGLNNIDEYSVYGSNPAATPYHVDAASGSDAYDGLSPVPSGGPSGPKKSIQAALSAAGSGDTIVVHPGTYAGPGNVSLSFAGKPMVLLAQAGPAATVLDGGHSAGAFNHTTLPESGVAIQGFTITRCKADSGGALRADATGLLVRNCILAGNPATAETGGLRSQSTTLSVDDLVLDAGGGTASTGVLTLSSLELQGDLTITSGRLDLRSSRVEGPGGILLDPWATLQISKVSGLPSGASVPPTIVRTSLTGTGQVVIDPGQELVLDTGAVVNLQRRPEDQCSDPPGVGGGRIVVNGTLLARGSAVIEQTNICVNQAEVQGTSRIQNNNIRLLENSTGFGGQFYIEDTASIIGNHIISEGDRYLDLDPQPNPHVPHPEVRDNIIEVLIKPGTPVEQGTLLELRSPDLDCASPAQCPSGAFQGGSGYADKWVLERLELEPNAKLNLTNRQGFDFSAGSEPDTVYVKRLVLNPGAVLNVAGQRLYYQELIGDPGQIVDVPLLGFSLGVIGMNDDTEFEVRLNRRLTDPDDGETIHSSVLLPQGEIQRIVLGPGDTPPNEGVMRMMTHKAGELRSASSVAVKGQFARAAEDLVDVVFQYRFCSPAGELIVKISGHRQVGSGNVEVARILPEPNAPGSMGNGFAVFQRSVPRGDLDFLRGTFIELELRGQDACVLIDNFDPRIECSTHGKCGDLNNNWGVVNAEDYLLLLASYGQIVRADDPTAEQPTYRLWCLDLTGDKYVDANDLLVWEAAQRTRQDLCGDSLQAPVPGMSAAASGSAQSSEAASVLIAGKQRSESQNDFLYRMAGEAVTVDADGRTRVAPGVCPGVPLTPADGPGTRANGRLIPGPDDEIYQIHSVSGLFRIHLDAAHERVLKPGSATGPAGQTIYVGIDTEGGTGRGLPLSDAVIRREGSDTYAYVVPAVVETADGTSRYRAAARLRLKSDATFDVVNLYGEDPGPSELTWSPVDRGRPREIELDESGATLYVVSAQAFNSNDFMLVYDTADSDSAPERIISMHSLFEQQDDVPRAATAVLLAGDELYLAAAVNPRAQASTRIYRFSLDTGCGTGLCPAGWVDILNPTIENPYNTNPTEGYVKALALDGNGDLWVAGVVAPTFNENQTPPGKALFTTPTIALVKSEWFERAPAGLEAAVLACNHLALPAGLALAAPLPAGPAADFDGNGWVDAADYIQLQACGTGPALPHDGTPTCRAADLDQDGDVDQTDFGIFQRCFSGTGQPVAADCAK